MDSLCDQPSIVLAITPLTAIMKDDVITGDLFFHAFSRVCVSHHQTHHLRTRSGSARLNTMGNSMSPILTEARLLLPKPTMPFMHIWDSQRFWLL